MKKKTFYTELAYVIGLVVLAFGTALMELVDFGVSMIVAPAYLLHLKISTIYPFFSFGMAEYVLQAIILVIMVIVLRKVKISYFFSFVTAVLYGLVLDGAMTLVAGLSTEHIGIRVLIFVIGMLSCACGVSLLFHTYISPEAYELFVKEVSARFKIDINKFKTAYDCASCIISIVLSFAFFGLWQFEGIGVGTIVCALLNGFLIASFTKLLEKVWDFKDGLKLRRYFE